MEAAKHFIEIDPDAFLDVLKGGRSHPFYDAIDELASHGNNLHDRDTVQELYTFASDVDNVKIRNATMRDPMGRLVKLQGRVITELAQLRMDLRDWKEDQRKGDSGLPPVCHRLTRAVGKSRTLRSSSQTCTSRTCSTRILYTAIVGNGCRMSSKDLQKKTSVAFDDRTLKAFRKQADRLNLSVSAFLRLVAAKLESGEIRV